MTTILLLKSEYERIGGPESLIRSLATAIDQTRYELVLGVVRDPSQAPLCAYPSSLRQVELPWHGLGGLLSTARCAARLASQTNAALVHSHDMRANAIAAAMRLFGRRPWIAHVHGWLGPTHHGRWRLYEAVDRQLVRTADRVLVGSRAAQEEVRGSGAKRVDIVSNAVTLPAGDAMADDAMVTRSTIGAADDAVVLGVLGRLHPGKGHEFFLRALATLIQGGLNVHGLIVGEGADGERLRALAHTLGIENKVTFTGFVDDPSRYLGAIDVVAVPSLKDSLPLTALEAMSYARPVVASCAGDLPVLIMDGGNGFIVPIGDASALADKLRVLAEDAPLRRRMGAAGRQRIIDGFSAETMARGLEGQYASVIAAVGADDART